MNYVDTWDPSKQTPEAKQALREWTERKHASGERLDPHDPEMLMCLDKGDIVSRYLLLLEQSRAEKRQIREHHDYELRRIRDAAGSAVEWWRHCIELRRRKRKTANLADMPDVNGSQP